MVKRSVQTRPGVEGWNPGSAPALGGLAIPGRDGNSAADLTTTSAPVCLHTVRSGGRISGGEEGQCLGLDRLKIAGFQISVLPNSLVRAYRYHGAIRTRASKQTFSMFSLCDAPEPWLPEDSEWSLPRRKKKTRKPNGCFPGPTSITSITILVGRGTGHDPLNTLHPSHVCVPCTYRRSYEHRRE